MKFIDVPHGGGFGSRLRRLVDRLDRDVTALYRDAGLGFEPRWYAVFTALLVDGPATVGELAQRLGVTHAAVSQVRSALLAEGLIVSHADASDGRRHVLAISAKGAALAVQLKPLWDAINNATAAILAEEAPTLVEGLDALTSALDRDALRDRVALALEMKTPA